MPRRLLGPPLWILDVANVLAVGERRCNLTSDQIVRSMGLVERLLGETIETIASAVSFRRLLSTARSFSVTAYDVVYLETARSEGLPLATLDRALRAAALKSGVELLS
jgi:predicted nucleic acid-binding protein